MVNKITSPISLLELIDKTNDIINALGTGGVTIDNETITTNADDELQTVGVINANSGDALHSWTGTKAEYDAIVTKDPNTLYDITDDSTADAYEAYNKSQVDTMLSNLHASFLDEIYYKAGDSYSGGFPIITCGFISAGTKSLYFNVIFPKRLDNVTVTINSLLGDVRTAAGGYLYGGNGSGNINLLTVGTLSALRKSDNKLWIAINSSAAISGATNNSVVAVLLNTFNFSFS